MLTDKADRKKIAATTLIRASINSNELYQHAMSVAYSAISAELNLAQGNIRESIKRYFRVAAYCARLHTYSAMRFCYRRAIEIAKDRGRLDVLTEIWLEYDDIRTKTEELKVLMLKAVFEIAATMDIEDFPYEKFVNAPAYRAPQLHGLIRSFLQIQRVKRSLSAQA